MNTSSQILEHDDDHEHVVAVARRSFRRTLMIAGIVALAVVGVESAEASTDAVSGFTYKTWDTECSRAVRVDFHMVQDEEGWTFRAIESQTSCTANVKISPDFVGDWDPTGIAPCDHETLSGCLVGPEGTFVDFGPMPDRQSLQAPIIQFCDQTACEESNAVAWRH